MGKTSSYVISFLLDARTMLTIIFNKRLSFGRKMTCAGGTVTYFDKNGETVSETRQRAKIVVDRYDYTPIELLKFVYDYDSILRKEWASSFGSI